MMKFLTAISAWLGSGGKILPLKCTDNADQTGTLNVVVQSSGAGTDATQVQGNVAHDEPDDGQPVAIGGIASDDPPANVGILDRVKAWFRRNGAQAIYNAYGHNPDDDKVANVEGAHVEMLTPEISTSAYTANDFVGGDMGLNPLTLDSSADRLVQLFSLTVKETGSQKAELWFYFLSEGYGGTYVDQAAATLDADDVRDHLMGVVKIVAADYLEVGGACVASIKNIGLLCKTGPNGGMTVLCITKGTPTYAAANSLSFTFGFKQH